ncbi:MAG: hypothetical protein FWG81_09125 [Betaproteobacteria bacterium]|nr:hypothetical protein [Betaproteobacteria bacterium]
MSALKSLRKELKRALNGRPRQLGWGDPESMRDSLAAVRERFTRRSGAIPAERVARGVLALRVLGAGVDFVHLKYACYGIAQHADWNGRRLLEDAALVKKLLGSVEALRPNARRFAACCRGLRHSWQEASTLPQLPATREGRALLKSFLLSCELQ